MVLPVRFLHNSTGSNALLELVGLWVGGLRSTAEQAHFYDYWLLKEGRRNLLTFARERVADQHARHHILGNETWGARVLSYLPGKEVKGVEVVTPVDKGVFHVASRSASNFDSLETMPDPVSNGKGEVILLNEPHHGIMTDINCSNTSQEVVRQFLRFSVFLRSQGIPITNLRLCDYLERTIYSITPDISWMPPNPELWDVAGSWRLRKEPVLGALPNAADPVQPADLVEDEPRIGKRKPEEVLRLHKDWRKLNVGSLFRKGGSEVHFWVSTGSIKHVWYVIAL